MAYNQPASYEAHRQAYYDQHQQAPVQQQNGGYPPQQQYDGYDGSYDQGYGQPHQQHGGYEDHGYDMNQQHDPYYGDYGEHGHEQYDQGYAQQEYGRQDYGRGGYPQQPNGHGRPNDGHANVHQEAYSSRDRQYDPRAQQRPGRGGHQPQSNRHDHPREGHGGQHYVDSAPQDRQYDPRYQQRPSRGGHPPSSGPKSQRPAPGSNEDYWGPPPQSRDRDPRDGYPQQPLGHQGQAREGHGEDPRNGHGERGGARDVRDRADKRPAHPQSNGGSRHAQPTPHEPKKSAMEEWKAKEKARLREAASQPKVIPQDTAFPTFASNKNDEKQAGGQGGASRRISEDHERPSTSSGRNGSRPPGSRSNNHQQRPGPSDVNGRSHQQSHSTRTPQHEQSTQSQRQTDGIGRRPVQGHNDPPPRRYIDPNPPFANMPPGMQRPQGREPPAGSQRVVSPPQTQASPPQTISAPVVKTPKVPEPQPESTSTAESDEYYPQESWRTGPPKKRPQAERPPKREASPVVPPQESGRTGSSNTTSQNPVAAQQPEVVRKPVNPPTAPPPQAEPPATYQMPSRVLSLDEQQPRSGSQPTHAPAKNFARPNVVPVVPAHEESLDDLYDDYYGAAQPQHVYVPPPPKNRDEEIEAEMPDFDSAAPGQTSGVHKRIQVVDKHPSEAHPQMPGMPPQHFNASVQPLPVHGHNPYGNYQEPAVASQPELGDIRYDGSGATDGFVFGVPGEQARPEQHYADPRQVPPNQQAMAYRPAQSVPPESMRRFQTPVDQRQMNMPMHSSPPGEHPQMQRFPPGGHGPILPKQRSASTRPPMTQTGWSDPGMQRAPTAPPMRQDSYGAPHYGPPRTGGLANQQHRAPSAPPGQQPMRGMPPPGMPRNGPPFGQQQHMRPRRPSETDALPHHPAPFRPGLMEQGAPRQPKPTPVRNYDNRSSSSSHQRQVSISDGPITNEDLEQARLDMEANKASPRLSLRYAKKLVEASHVLASEGGRLDAKATQRNREKYLNEAYKRVKELVRNTYPEAQFYMAECYGSGELGLGVDPKEAFALYQAAAKGGHAAAAFRTAVSCEIGPEEGGGTRKDYPKAVQWYRRAAALGDVAAMFKLGIILLRGLLGVPRNVGEAVSWLKRAAERADKDNPHALHELATLHEPGNPDPQVREKVIPDEAYALSLFKQAAEFGFKRSQFRLGQAYEYGSLGLDIDNRASIAWYTKAAAQGEHNAELALSGWYLTGAEGMLEQSDMEAYLWARKAAQSEPPLAKAMFAMGYFTEQGIGCPKSLEEAKRWYGRAASFQFPRALERLEELRKGNKNKSMQNGKLTRDKKKDDENCVVM